MPIASAIKGGCVINVHRDNALPPEQQVVMIREALETCVFVDAKAAAQLMASDGVDFEHSSDYPPIRAPYPEMWFEWQLGGSQWFAMAAENSSAEWPMHTPRGASRTICIVGGGMRDGAVYVLPAFLVAHANELGDVLGDTRIGRTRFQGIAKTITSAESISELEPAALAIGLMNCKNIDLSPPKQVHLKRSGRDKRRGESSAIKYRTIVLPSAPNGGTETGDGTPKALHKVRGHFKTYTAERPLMGKLVGTYWWNWSYRGNADYGKVISDYRLD